MDKKKLIIATIVTVVVAIPLALFANKYFSPEDKENKEPNDIKRIS